MKKRVDVSDVLRNAAQSAHDIRLTIVARTTDSDGTACSTSSACRS
jgi:hypothetical protein